MYPILTGILNLQILRHEETGFEYVPRVALEEKLHECDIWREFHAGLQEVTVTTYGFCAYGSERILQGLIDEKWLTPPDDGR